MGAASVSATAAASGGYFPETWGWSGLALLGAVVVAMVLATRVRLTRTSVAFVAALTAFVTWIGVSASWTDSVTRTVLELERGVLYLAAVLAFACLGRPPRALAAGVAAAATAVALHALVERARGDGAPRLAGSVGYWNSLGILAVLGSLVCVGFASRRAGAGRGLAAAALVVLLPTLHLTYSRGSWVALAVGAAVTLALAPDRVRSALTIGASGLAAAGAIGVVEALRPGPAVAVLLGLAAAGGAAPTVVDRLSDRTAAVAERARLGLVARAAAAVGVVAVALALGFGGTATSAYESFTSSPAPRAEVGGRPIFSASGAGRAEYWRVAWRQFRARPFTGAGAGTFEFAWHEERTTVHDARDAHSFYVETLGELGAPGLVIAAVALAIPLLAAARGARTAVGAGAAGAFSAYLVHGGVDWDWEVPAVTLAALACAVAAMGTAAAPSVVLGRRARAALAVGCATAMAFVSATYAGNVATARSASAFEAGRYGDAATEARRAARWLPWSSDPWRLLGTAQLAAGQAAAARRSHARGIERDPLDWRLWLGLALASRGHERDVALERAAQLNPLGRELLAIRAGS